MDQSELNHIVIAALLSVAPNVEPTALDPARSFRDQFDFDSIDQLNFVLALQEALEIQIPELDYPQLAGLGAAGHYLGRQLAAGQRERR